MRVLFDLTHPAHVHLFRNAIAELEERGHQVYVTSREKDVTCDLLDAYGIDHHPLTSKPRSAPGLALEWTVREFRLLRAATSFDPDVFVSRLDPAVAHVAWLLGRPSVVFDDSEKARLAGRLTHPFADVICTPSGYGRDLGPKQRRYDGIHEIAYLHPDRFEPALADLAACGVDTGETLYVLRFVDWSAHHDVGRTGFSLAAKRELVSSLSERGTVYVTSERPLPDEFRQYRAPVPPHLMLDLLAVADLYVGDSQTMATEAAVLGVPAVRSNSFAAGDDMSNFVELEEEYGLLFSIPSERAAVAKASALASDPTTGAEWERKRTRFFEDKIDVTRYMVETILAVGRGRSGDTAMDDGAADSTGRGSRVTGAGDDARSDSRRRGR